MADNVTALKALYVALGGKAADVAEAVTITDVLNIISAHYEGESDANVNADAINNIAAVADNIGGGGNDVGFVERTLTDYVIPDGVTKIGKYAFAYMADLESVEIPDTVTTIDEGAFSHSSIKSINIPMSVTTLGAEAFIWCKSLTDITSLGAITAIPSHAFGNCGFTSLVIPNTVETIESYALSTCSSLTSLEIPSSVTTIANNAFYNSSRLATITIHKAEGSITGAPWGAPSSANIVWTGE